MKDTKERRNAKQQCFKGKLCVLYTKRLYKRSYIEATRVYKKIQYVKKQKIKQDYGKNENVVNLVDLTKISEPCSKNIEF